jgi:hypothetical protein
MAPDPESTTDQAQHAFYRNPEDEVHRSRPTLGVDTQMSAVAGVAAERHPTLQYGKGLLDVLTRSLCSVGLNAGAASSMPLLKQRFDTYTSGARASQVRVPKSRSEACMTL